MKLFICMVGGGSICTLLYIIFNCILSYELELRWKNIFLKINIMFYLLPIPWITVKIKGILKWMLEKTGIDFQTGQVLDIIYPNNIWESIAIMNDNNKTIFLTGYQKWIPFVLIVSAVFFIMIFMWVITYLVIGNHYKKDIFYVDTAEDAGEVIKGRRKIRIGFSSRVHSPVTIGIIKPIILLPADNEKYAVSAKGIVRHELNHIINMDGLFRFFTFAVVAMGWYNPLVYYLLRENIAVSEMLCDEAAVDGMSKEEKMSYMECIIEAVRSTKDSETLIMALGKTEGLSKERMKRIMKKNKKKNWKSNLAAGIIVLCFIISSFPALAYKEPVEYTESNYLNSELEEWNHIDMVSFTLAGMGESDHAEAIDFSHNDNVFTNEEGKIFYNENTESYNQNQTRVICSHSYETGTLSKHFSNSDGSCKVVAYKAQRCAKCGNTIIGTEISTTTYKVCSH